MHGAIQHAALHVPAVGREAGDLRPGVQVGHFDEELCALERGDDFLELVHRRAPGRGAVAPRARIRAAAYGSANRVTIEPAAALSPAAGHVCSATPQPRSATRNPRRCTVRAASACSSIERVTGAAVWAAK